VAGRASGTLKKYRRGVVVVEVGTVWFRWSGTQPDGRCVCLLISPCTIKSSSSLLAPAHPGGPGKGAVKPLWVCVLEEESPGINGITVL